MTTMKKGETMIRKLIARLREPSSLAGLGALCILAGRADLAGPVADLAGAALGFLAVVVPEKAA